MLADALRALPDQQLAALARTMGDEQLVELARAFARRHALATFGIEPTTSNAPHRERRRVPPRTRRSSKHGSAAETTELIRAWLAARGDAASAKEIADATGYCVATVLASVKRLPAIIVEGMTWGRRYRIAATSPAPSDDDREPLVIDERPPKRGMPPAPSQPWIQTS